MALNPTHLKEIASAAERIYNERYKTEYEAKYPGKFVAIEVNSGKTFIGEFSEDTLQKASKECPGGLFHLIRVGSEGAFRVGYSRSNGSMDWLASA